MCCQILRSLAADAPTLWIVDDLHFASEDSRKVVKAMCEPELANAEPGTTYQFERVGYFHVDPKTSQPGKPTFLRTATLKDAWKKQQKKR